jgi:hypothetical protein
MFGDHFDLVRLPLTRTGGGVSFALSECAC